MYIGQIYECPSLCDFSLAQCPFLPLERACPPHSSMTSIHPLTVVDVHWFDEGTHKTLTESFHVPAHFKNVAFITRGTYGAVASAYDHTRPQTDCHADGRNNIIVKKLVHQKNHVELCKVWLLAECCC